MLVETGATTKADRRDKRGGTGKLVQANRIAMPLVWPDVTMRL